MVVSAPPLGPARRAPAPARARRPPCWCRSPCRRPRLRRWPRRLRRAPQPDRAAGGAVSLIAVASAKCSPGASTVAELTALLAPGTLRGCSSTATRPAASGCCAPGVRAEPGLVTLALAGRRDLGDRADPGPHAARGRRPRCRGGSGRRTPGRGALDILGARLGSHLAGLEDLETVVDCGRLDPRVPRAGGGPGGRPGRVGQPAHRRPDGASGPWVEQLVSEGAPGRGGAGGPAPPRRRSRLL